MRGPQGPPGPAGTELLPGQLSLGVGVPQVLSGARYGFGVPFGITFDGTHLEISNVGGSAVTEVNDSDGSLAQVLSSASYGFSNPAEVTSAGNHLWVVNENGNSVTAVQR